MKIAREDFLEGFGGRKGKREMVYLYYNFKSIIKNIMVTLINSTQETTEHHILFCSVCVCPGGFQGECHCLPVSKAAPIELSGLTIFGLKPAQPRT